MKDKPMSDVDDIIAAALADAESFEEQAELSLDDNEVKSIKRLSSEMMRLEDLVSKVEKTMKQANENLRNIRENLLPGAMIEAELKSIELEDGSKLTRSMKYIGSIKKDNEDAALEWFKTSGRVGVVTPTMTIPIAKGHLDEAEDTAKKLQDQGIPVILKPNVHWQTLRAVVRELYENGEEIPDCISTHVIDEAKIKRKS